MGVLERLERCDESYTVGNDADAAEEWNSRAPEQDLHRPAAAMTLTDVTVSATDTASGGRAVSWLHRQLDSFATAKNVLFLSRYQVLGHKHRRRGGEPALLQLFLHLHMCS